MNTQKTYHLCCLCSSADFEWIATNFSFGVKILRCSKCQLIQSEYVSDQALQDYYSDYYRSALTEADIKILRKLAHSQAVSQMEYLTSILPGVRFNNVLEIGSGLGELAKILAASHGNVYVTEADPQYVKHLKSEKSLNCLDGGDLRSDNYTGFFDLLVLSHVLEHLSNPLAMLNDISRVLKQDAYLFVELPNESEMLVNNNFQGKGHLYFYTIGTFNALIACQGSFDVVEIRTCNRTIQDYVASNFTLADDFSLKYSTNGTTIRALLVNKRPQKFSLASAEGTTEHGLLADEYSRRIVHLHHEILNLKTQLTLLQRKCKSAIKEARQIVLNTVASSKGQLNEHTD